MPNKWETWIANVKFEDDPQQVKQRPVLVLSPQNAFILSLKITSHLPRPQYTGEYPIEKWQEAGLDRASTIRISKRLRLLPSDFVRKLGRLHPADISAVVKALSE